MDAIERKTYRRHRAAALFEGSYSSIIWSTPEIARKGLGADHLMVTLIVMAPAVAQSLALFVAGRIAATHPRRLIRTFGFIGRLPIVLLFFLPADPWIFLTIVTWQALAYVPIISAWNGVLRSNYTESTRGRLFGGASRFQSVAGAITVIGSGFWAHHDPQAFRVFLPIAAGLGIISCLIFSGVPLRERSRAAPPAVRLGSPRALLRTLVVDRNFFRYELGFFCYGLGFMALGTALPFITVDHLDLDWNVLLGAKAIPSLIGVALAPFFGRVMDRIGAPRLGAYAFAGLIVYGGLLALAVGPVTYCLVTVVFGIAMTGVLILWNMGPVAFAKEGEAMRYMSVHVALVGLRGIIGHPIGGWIAAKAGDPRWVIVFSTILWILGSVVMWRLSQKMRREAAEAAKAAEASPEPESP